MNNKEIKIIIRTSSKNKKNNSPRVPQLLKAKTQK